MTRLLEPKVYERALKELPGSYKLWYSYLKMRRNQIKKRCITDPSYEEVNNAHERALVFMHKVFAERVALRLPRGFVI